MSKSEFIFGADGDDDDDQDEFVIDDSLDTLDRIKLYIKSDLVLHRLYLVRDLAESAREIGFEATNEHLLPIFEDLKLDPEPPVRQAFVEQLPSICRFFKEQGDDGYKRFLDKLLPIVAIFATDLNPQVRQSAMETLVEIGQIVERTDLAHHVLPIVRNMARDNNEEEHRVQAAQLINELAPSLEAHLLDEFVVQHVQLLTGDPMFRVRKAVASNLGNVCTSLGIDKTSEFILPLFVKLASDEIWGVRKACAESLVNISENVTAENRKKTLTSVFESLAEDPSRWVRNAAYQILGPFIATFPGVDVTDSLLGYYKNMAEDSKDTKFTDSDNVLYCAFNFPAVLLTLGRGRWIELSELYGKLVKDLQWKVRRTLSFSLHEVANILGTELTEEHLLGTFELFLKDLDEVKVGIIAHLTQFFGVLSSKSREQYLYILTEIQKDSVNWRFRKLIAKQMGDLSELYLNSINNNNTNTNTNIETPKPSEGKEKTEEEEIREIEKSLLPQTLPPGDVIVSVTLALLHDSVAAVRKALLKGIGKIINIVDKLPEKRKAFLDEIKSLVDSNVYQTRQMYGTIAEHSVGHVSAELFETELMPLLLEKAMVDPVPNVRITAARAMKKLSEHEPFSKNSKVMDAVQTLQKDKDRDVIFYSGGDPPPRGRPIDEPLLPEERNSK
jgi:serine/threonine-protein phosphatase 4 regulatory subunit 1